MKFIAKTLYGLEKVLAGELAMLGATDPQPLNRAVAFSGNRELMYRINYCSSTALSVLRQISEFRIRTKDDLYRGGSGIEWDQYMGADDTFSVTAVVNSPVFDHSGYAGLILKDSIADYFRKKYGRRPSVSNSDPKILVNLHISNSQVDISLDSSGIPLFKRGYRQEQSEAPLNEVLAAGILEISGWNSSTSLTDPMCGSGTIAIEAGLKACRIPPGKFRKSYSFRNWKDYDGDLFSRVVKTSDDQRLDSPVKIIAADISPVAVKRAEINIKAAGLSDFISVATKDFSKSSSEGKEGFIVMNPPYGERLRTEIDALYGMIGSTLKHNYPGNTACIITSNKEALKMIGLKPAAKHILYNGALECTLVRYELYQGTKKHISPGE